MKRIELHVKSLEFDRVIPDREAIWGQLFVEIGDICFPDDEWWDAVSSVLDMWLASVLTFVKKKQDQCMLCFMDGPFEIHLCVNDENTVSIICRERDGEIYANEIVDINMFIEALLKCTSMFLEECGQNIWGFSETRMYSVMSKARRNLEGYEYMDG